MTRVQAITIEKADSEVKPLLEAIQSKLGKIPNIFQNMANSQAVLKGFLDLSTGCENTSFSPPLREKIALAVAQSNQCQYCLSAHSAIGKAAGLSDDQLIQARKAHSTDPKEEALLNFTKKVVEQRGAVSLADVDALKATGVSDKELVELILLISLNIFTNYFNHITDPVVDFPKVSLNP